MGILDLSGKKALITGVSDDVGFAWFISKALAAAGAEVVLASHPRVVSIVERFLSRDKYQASRQLPYGVSGEFKPLGLIPCDVDFDRETDVPAALSSAKGYVGQSVSIEGAVDQYRKLAGDDLDILIHSVAFSSEITKTHLETSRSAYLSALSISAYSLVSMVRTFLPLMKGRDASVVGLSYLAAERVNPGYGGGMATAKAALESDARNVAWFAGEEAVRVNLISAGPYASRAAKSIGDINSMIEVAAQRSPLRRAITPQDVADAALFLCSPLSRNISGEVVHVDAGFHAMSASMP